MTDVPTPLTPNADSNVIRDFGLEWQQFNQAGLSEEESRRIFESYFAVFPWEKLPPGASGFDLGCGSGRWARLVAPKVGRLHCIDPSQALEVARRNLADQPNCEFHLATVDQIPLPDNSLDFGYSLGVLHHVPDTSRGVAACVAKLKPGAPFLLYLYYAFDNRPFWFVALWRVSDGLRRIICRLPFGLKNAVCQVIALTIYFPLARAGLLLEKMGFNPVALPLSAYRNKSMYVMRTDALDRFGTRLEQRFTREQMRRMMTAAGLEQIAFIASEPFWCAVGIKRAP
jgi:SAM-dependent methyltransferase